MAYFLRPASIADIPDIVRLWNNGSQALIHENEVDESTFREDFVVPQALLAAATCVLTTEDDDPIGYGELLDMRPQDGLIHGWLRLDPAHISTGNWRTLLTWAEGQTSQLSGLLGLPEITLRLRHLDLETEIGELLTQHGFRVGRSVRRMELRLDDPPGLVSVPEQFRLRPMAAEELDETLEVYRAAFDGQWGHPSRPFDSQLADWEAWYRADHTDPNLWFVAEGPAGIAGMCLCELRPNGKGNIGWVSEFGVHPDVQGNGIGSALLTYSLNALYQRDARQFGLNVDAENPTAASALYERAGFSVRYVQLIYEKRFPAAG